MIYEQPSGGFDVTLDDCQQPGARCFRAWIYGFLHIGPDIPDVFNGSLIGSDRTPAFPSHLADGAGTRALLLVRVEFTAWESSPAPP